MFEQETQSRMKVTTSAYYFQLNSTEYLGDRKSRISRKKDGPFLLIC